MTMYEESTSDPVFEQEIRTLKRLDLGSCDEKDDDPCGEVMHDGQYKLEKLLRKDHHADVYSVWSIPRDSSVEGLEARVYVVEDIPDKLRQYRLRSIKRLSSRSVLEVRKNRLVIVLYKVEGGSVEGPANGMVSEPTPRKDERGERTQDAKTQQKSDRQRETARLRQLERRKCRRQKEQQNKTESNRSDSERVVEGVQEENDEEETLYVLLHLAYNHRPELRQQLPPASRVALEKYLQSQPLKFEDDDEMDAFMAIKLREVLFLGRQEKKLPDIEKRRKREYADLLKQHLLLHNGSEAYKSMQNRVTIAQHKLRVIRHVQELLPKVIGDAEKLYRDLKQRLKLVRELKGKIEELRALSTERDRLKRNVVFCEKISQEVVPGSGPYAQAVSQLQTAEKALRSFDARVDGTSMVMLESLKKEYENLLVASVKEADIESRSPHDTLSV
jgi:hypothetical protein